ncbi:MAG: S-layer homology domain-containing protein [Clostridia bacterium]
MLKRSILLATSLFFLSMTTADARLISFPDVLETDWFHGDVQELVGKNVVHGFPDGFFRPHEPIQADQFLKMVVSGLGHAVDTEGEYWAAPYISKALELGILKDGEIHQTNAPVPRGAIALILARSMDALGEKVAILPYTLYDVKGSMPEEIAAAVQKVFSAGIITGYPDKTFRHNGFITRAEACAVINRLFAPIYRREPERTDNALAPASFLLEGSLGMETEFLAVKDMHIRYKVDPMVYEQVRQCLYAIYDERGYTVVEYRKFNHAEYVQIAYYFDKNHSQREEYSLFTFRIFNGKPSYPETYWGYDTMAVKLEMKRLWWSDALDPHSRTGETFYEQKLKGALCSLFGTGTGEELWEYVLHRYKHSDHSQGDITECFSAGNIRCIYFSHHLHRGYHFTFSEMEEGLQ